MRSLYCEVSMVQVHDPPLFPGHDVQLPHSTPTLSHNHVFKPPPDKPHRLATATMYSRACKNCACPKMTNCHCKSNNLWDLYTLRKL
jgi:hypothetical protein